jgi:hypothetical protein
VDITDFFTNVTGGKIQAALKQHIGIGLKPIDQQMGRLTLREIIVLVTYGGHLPQGAPTSPFMSNIAFASVDWDIERLAKEYNLVYTRYADDLVFSGRKFPYKRRKHAAEFLSMLQLVLAINSYTINWDKIRITKPNRAQRVLGITVNEKVSVPRRTRRNLRAALHRHAINGIPLTAKLRGMLAWVKSVNPEQYDKLYHDWSVVKPRKEIE